MLLLLTKKQFALKRYISFASAVLQLQLFSGTAVLMTCIMQPAAHEYLLQWLSQRLLVCFVDGHQKSNVCNNSFSGHVKFSFWNFIA